MGPLRTQAVGRKRSLPSCLAAAATSQEGADSEQRRVRFATGPLPGTPDGHPPHEGLTAQQRRVLSMALTPDLTPSNVRLLEQELGEDCQPSVTRLKRRAGMLPPLKRPRTFVSTANVLSLVGMGAATGSPDLRPPSERPSLSGPVIPPLRPTPGSSSRAQQGVSWSLRGAPVDSGHRKVDKQAPAAPAGGKHPTPAVTPVGPHLRSCHARAWPQPVGGSPSQGPEDEPAGQHPSGSSPPSEWTASKPPMGPRRSSSGRRACASGHAAARTSPSGAGSGANAKRRSSSSMRHGAPPLRVIKAIPPPDPAARTSPGSRRPLSCASLIAPMMQQQGGQQQGGQQQSRQGSPPQAAHQEVPSAADRPAGYATRSKRSLEAAEGIEQGPGLQGAPAEPQGCCCSLPDVPEDRSGGSTIQLPRDHSPPSQQRHGRIQSGHGRPHAGSIRQRNGRPQESHCTDAGACNTPGAFAIDPGQTKPEDSLTAASGPPGRSHSKSESLISAPSSPPPHSDEDRANSTPSSSSPVIFSPASTALPRTATTAGPGA